jgi:hypothetical protein
MKPASSNLKERIMYKITHCARIWLPVALLQSRISDQGQNKDKDKPGTRKKKTSTGLRTGKEEKDP